MRHMLKNLTPPRREKLMAMSKPRRLLWNLWFAAQAQSNVIRAFHPGQADIPFGWANIFGRRLFTLNDPDLIHQVLVRHHDRYIKGQFFDRLTRPGLGESVLTAEGASWAYRRKMIAPAFAPRAIVALQTRMAMRIEEAVRATGATMQVQDWAAGLALNIALDGLFSGAAGDQTAHLAYNMQRGIDLYGQISTADALNLPAWVPRPAKRQAKRHADQVDAVVYALIDQRQVESKVQDQPDLLDMILNARDEATGRGLSRQDIRNEVFTFFAAGHDTSANAIAWALYLLADRPEAQDRAHEDRAYLERVVMEVLRLYPPIFALIREAIVPDVLNGIKVPVGALIVIPTYYLHRSPAHWEDPLAFDPDRFLPERLATRAKYAYIPFGLGPRVCPGKMMAQQTLKLTLFSLLTAYKINRADDYAIEPYGKMTLRPSHPMRLNLKPRA